MHNFNDHQYRILKTMLQSIDAYLKDFIFYADMVGQLEGALDAGEFHDDDFILKWYDLWTPLEIARAVHGSNVNKSDVSGYIASMEKFLREIVDV